MSAGAAPSVHEVGPVGSKAGGSSTSRSVSARRAERRARRRAAFVPCGDWEPPPLRRSPVELLEEQAATRVPELVPIRYGRMLVSPFTFYRGAAYLMASDLAGMPRTGLHTQLCGDAHLSNFGAFAAPDRRAGVQHQRLRRDAAGAVRVGRQAPRRQLRRRRPRPRLRRQGAERRSTSRSGEAYRESIARFAGMSNLDLWYTRMDVEDLGALFAQERDEGAVKRYRAQPREDQHEGPA